MNAQISRLALIGLALIVALILGTTYWQAWASGGLADRQDNAIQRVAQFTIERGKIYAGDGHTLLATNIRKRVDGRTLYFSDTPRFVIYRFDYDPNTGEAVNRRVFARIEPTNTDRGRPDGAAVDAEGCYWSSLYEGSRIRRYDPDGKMMADYSVPALNTTMPAFGGADLKTLFVTTARDKKGGPGGGLYAMPVDVPGLRGALFDPQA